MFDSKRLFQRLFRPLAARLAAIGVRPNHVTLAALCASLAAGGALLAWPTARWPLALVPLVLLARLVCNHVDGLIAREHAMATPLGALLNELCDIASDAALYLPLAAVPGAPAEAVIAAVVLGLLIEVAGIAAIGIGAARRDDGPMAKKPRGVFFATVMFALAFGAPPGPWLAAAFAAFVPLLGLTLVLRIARACRAATGARDPC